MRRQPLEVISLSDLSSWSTKRLLGRLKNLRRLEEIYVVSDMTLEESEHWCAGKIGFKSDPRWCEAYRDVKELLASREHI